MTSDNDQQFSNSNQTIGFPEFVTLLNARKVEDLEDEILAGNVDPSSYLSNNTDRDNLMAVVGGPSAQSQEPMTLVKKIDTEQISFIRKDTKFTNSENSLKHITASSHSENEMKDPFSTLKQRDSHFTSYLKMKRRETTSGKKLFRGKSTKLVTSNPANPLGQTATLLPDGQKERGFKNVFKEMNINDHSSSGSDSDDEASKCSKPFSASSYPNSRQTSYSSSQPEKNCGKCCIIIFPFLFFLPCFLLSLVSIIDASLPSLTNNNNHYYHHY